MYVGKRLSLGPTPQQTSSSHDDDAKLVTRFVAAGGRLCVCMWGGEREDGEPVFLILFHFIFYHSCFLCDN